MVGAVLVPELLRAIPGCQSSFFRQLEADTGVRTRGNCPDRCMLHGDWEALNKAYTQLEALSKKSAGSASQVRTLRPWFNIKMPSYQFKKSHCGDKTVAKSYDLLFSRMGFPVLVRWHLYIKSEARSLAPEVRSLWNWNNVGTTATTTKNYYIE